MFLLLFFSNFVLKQIVNVNVFVILDQQLSCFKSVLVEIISINPKNSYYYI